MSALQAGNNCGTNYLAQCLQVCHCEAPKGPWQSREGSCDFAEVSLLSGHVLRDCHVASLLAMTRQAGAAVHQCPRAVELPRTGRSLTAATLACALGGVPPKLRPARRSLSAATDAIGLYVFIDSLCESAALRRARLSPPLQWRVRSTMVPGNLQLPMAVTTRKGHAASVRRQSRQRLRSDRRYRRNRFLRFYLHLVRTGSAFPRLPRRFAPRNDTSGEREVHQCPPAV